MRDWAVFEQSGRPAAGCSRRGYGGVWRGRMDRLVGDKGGTPLLRRVVGR